MKELVFESIDCCEKNEKILWDNWNLQSDLKNTYSYCVKCNNKEIMKICKRKIASTLTFLGGCFAATDI